MEEKETQFDKVKFNDLVEKADADSELDFDIVCLKSARSQYQEALKLNPPENLKMQIEKKLEIVEANMAKLK